MDLMFLKAVFFFVSVFLAAVGVRTCPAQLSDGGPAAALPIPLGSQWQSSALTS